MSNVKVIMLGTGSPRPNLERFQSSQVLIADDLPILIDCGEAATYQLLRAGVQPQDVKHLFLTHLHTDHVLGYGQFLIGGWMVGRRELTVVGPKGTKKFHDRIIELYEADIDYRIKLGRPTNGILDVNVIEIEEPGDVPSGLPYKVKTDSMIHNVPTFGYRFEIGNKVVVFSGDTAKTQALVDLAKDADLLIQDAVITPRKNKMTEEYLKIQENLKKEHCTPAQCAETAVEAGVKKLVLTHLFEDIDEKQVHQEAADKFDGEVIVAKDLDEIIV